MNRLAEKVADGQVLSLIERFLKASVMDDAGQWTPTSGAPQGAWGCDSPGLLDS
jgi:RNA-directed DNA polymerase